MSVESFQVIRDSNTLIVTSTLDQPKLVTPLFQQYPTGEMSADPEETPPSVEQQNHDKTQLNTTSLHKRLYKRVQIFHMGKQFFPASPFAFL